MLRLTPTHPLDTVWDGLLPPEVLALPEDLARLSELLGHDAMLAPFLKHWDQKAKHHGRPSIPMAVYLRLMVVKHRNRWGYETLMREVSDSFHLRRFCQVALHEHVPDESTVRKLTRRLGSAVVEDLIRDVIVRAQRERRFRPRAMRTDSTVAEADIRYPTDVGLCADAVRRLASAARRVTRAVPSVVRRVRDRSRAVGKRIRALSRTLKRRTGEAKQGVQRFTEQAARLVRHSLGEARRLLAEAKRRRARAKAATSRGRQRALRELEAMIGLSVRVVEQVGQRFANEKIPDRIVSLADPQARVIRRGKHAKPNEFGYVVQFAEITAHTRRGARGLILPPKLAPGSTHDNTLLQKTVAELEGLEIRLREAAFDGGFTEAITKTLLEPRGCTPFVVGSSKPPSRYTKRRLARYRVGCEGRISHLKRSYHAGRSLLRGTEGARIWESWAVLVYNLDTVARL
jgi:transposase, IS5 family